MSSIKIWNDWTERNVWLSEMMRFKTARGQVAPPWHWLRLALMCLDHPNPYASRLRCSLPNRFSPSWPAKFKFKFTCKPHPQTDRLAYLFIFSHAYSDADRVASCRTDNSQSLWPSVANCRWRTDCSTEEEQSPIPVQQARKLNVLSLSLFLLLLFTVHNY